VQEGLLRSRRNGDVMEEDEAVAAIHLIACWFSPAAVEDAGHMGGSCPLPSRTTVALAHSCSFFANPASPPAFDSCPIHLPRTSPLLLGALVLRFTRHPCGVCGRGDSGDACSMDKGVELRGGEDGKNG
jgi:hypothetical protein